VSALETYVVTRAEAERLREELERRDEIVDFSSAMELAERVASLGMHREAGTLNDELARFLFDVDRGECVARGAIRSEMVRYGEAIGWRVRVENVPRLELRFRGLKPLLHPRFSFNDDGTLHSLVVFPRTVAAFLKSEGVEPVLVRPWALNTIFGGFDPAMHYYQTNFWELEHNDSLRFARLVEQRRIPFLGTHDLVAHISGTRGEAWSDLSRWGRWARELLETYFAGIRVPSIASLVIPYTLGVLLDDLAQPPTYGAESRKVVMRELARALEQKAVPSDSPLLLMRFPAHYEQVIDLARDPSLERIRKQAPGMVKRLAREIREQSVVLKAS
jgi:hypothetical protein